MFKRIHNASILALIILNAFNLLAQEPFQNFGNLKIHDNGAIGFHNSLINNGPFDENLGLAGFFNENSTDISGALRPIFQDMEVMVRENLFLEVGVGITGHLNFVDGTIVTPRTLTDINTDFITDAFYTGEEDPAKVNGYASMTNMQKFRFPIGDADRIRTLLLEIENDTISAKSAYFYENPNTPSTLGQSFDTSITEDDITAVSIEEFWHLISTRSGRVEIIWDPQSRVESLVETVDNLTVVGWNNTEQIWQDLGVSAKKGDLEYGRIVSGFFDTSVYSIITFGGNKNTDVSFTNYLITPNRDGINDYLVLEDIEKSPNNILKIFNRWGKEVYTQENYEHDFTGISNREIAIGKNKVLPVGVYFYVIELKDIDVIHQGYLYINE